MCMSHYNSWLRKTGFKSTRKQAKQDILAALPGSRAEIEARTERNATTIRTWLHRMRGTEVYISSWRSDGPTRIPVYSKGAKPDVPCTIPRMTDAEYRRRYKIANAERLRLRWKARWAVVKANSRQANWASALGIRP